MDAWPQTRTTPGSERFSSGTEIHEYRHPRDGGDALEVFEVRLGFVVTDGGDGVWVLSMLFDQRFF